MVVYNKTTKELLNSDDIANFQINWIDLPDYEYRRTTKQEEADYVTLSQKKELEIAKIEGFNIIENTKKSKIYDISMNNMENIISYISKETAAVKKIILDSNIKIININTSADNAKKNISSAINIDIIRQEIAKFNTSIA